MGFPDNVTAVLRVAELGNSSVRYGVALCRNDEDSAAAEGYFTHVYVSRESHRPSPIEEDRRKAFRSLMREA